MKNILLILILVSSCSEDSSPSSGNSNNQSDPSGEMVYVCAQQSDKIYVLDASDLSILNTVEVTSGTITGLKASFTLSPVFILKILPGKTS